MSQSTADRITFRCECGAKLGLRRNAAGHRAQCPKCKEWFTVPGQQGKGAAPPPLPPAGKPAPARRPASAPASETQTAVSVRRSTRNPELAKVECGCGKKFGVPITACGRKARCPSCREVLLVPDIESARAAAAPPTSPTPSPPAVPPTQPPEDDDLLPFAEEDTGDDGRMGMFAGAGGGSLLDELGDGEEITAAVGSAPAPAFISCPNCARPMPAAARTCDACGYDTKKGKVPGVKVKSKSSGGGSSLAESGVVGLLIGSVLSVIGAGIGAAIWCAVVVFTGYELALMAWLIGLMAGGGMYLGSRNQQMANGIIASIIAIVAFIGAKILIIVVILFVAVAGVVENMDDLEESSMVITWDPAGNVDDLRGQLARHYALLEMRQEGLRDGDPKYDLFYKEQSDRLQKRSTPEIRAEVQEVINWEEGGKWDDAAYVRAFLIYDATEIEIENARRAGDIPEKEEITDEQWATYYGICAERIDQIHEDRRVDLAQEREAARAWADFGAQFEESLEEEVGPSGGPKIFGWMTFVGFFLAISSAYKIAGGGFGG